MKSTLAGTPCDFRTCNTIPVQMHKRRIDSRKSYISLSDIICMAINKDQVKCVLCFVASSPLYTVHRNEVKRSIHCEDIVGVNLHVITTIQIRPLWHDYFWHAHDGYH